MVQSTRQEVEKTEIKKKEEEKTFLLFSC